MALSYKTRKRLSIFVMFIGLPLYIIVAWGIMGMVEEALGRLNIWVELVIYTGLGVLWALPLKAVFLGVGKADPEAEEEV